MPAIDIARLKIQAATLVEKFDQPAAFLKQTHEILDLYADRTMRTGVVAAPISVLPAYRTPAAVLKQIEIELSPLATTFPEQTMGLTDALWKDGYLETRLLAAILLGRVHPSTALLKERISAWVNRTRDQQLRNALLTTSLNRIRRETPEQFLQLVKEWFDPNETKMWSNGIHALIPLLADPSYDNLPPVFDIVKPVITSAPNFLQNEMIKLINALFEASPMETIYFMKQTILASSLPQTVVAMRRIQDKFPAPLQDAIREQLRQKR